MLRSTKFRIRPRRGRGEGGYVLITLMLFVTLLVIAAVAAIPELKFQIQRDREEEMVHRGVQYTRAIRRYYKKFGTYPATMDLLESSNNVRFLRKRYKDPINGQDFKILHFTDVKFFNQQGIAGAQTLGQPIGSGMGGTQDTSAGTAQDQNTGATTATTAPPQSTDTSTAAASGGTPQTADGSQAPTGAGGGGSILPFAPAPLLGNNGNGNTFGGAGIVGVSSISTKDTIRVYNKKTHYNEWQFVYDPTSDRGGMVTGPYQPSLQAILPGQNGQQTNQPGGLQPGGIQPSNGPGNNPMQPNNDVPLQQ